MKNTLLPLLFVFLAAGCGSDPVSVEPPGPVNGEWSGLVYESSIDLFLTLRVEDNYGIGSMEYRGQGSSFYPVVARIIGDTERFSMHLQVGADFNPPWYYTGYVKDGALCLERDALPEPVRCLTPLQPSATHQTLQQK